MTSDAPGDKSPHDGSEEALPRASDSSHRPSEEMKRGSRITAIATVIFIVFWILLGTRHAFFGS